MKDKNKLIRRKIHDNKNRHVLTLDKKFRNCTKETHLATIAHQNFCSRKYPNLTKEQQDNIYNNSKLYYIFTNRLGFIITHDFVIYLSEHLLKNDLIKRVRDKNADKYIEMLDKIKKLPNDI